MKMAGDRKPLHLAFRRHVFPNRCTNLQEFAHNESNTPRRELQDGIASDLAVPRIGLRPISGVPANSHRFRRKLLRLARAAFRRRR
jgi:hypothetical protein